jgi:ribosome biogenesis SPOUT family RNA methylase Rps3
LALVAETSEAEAKVARARRPEPPRDLTPEQAVEWRAIVAGMPADWFRRETYPLLSQYCRCAVSVRKLGKVRDQLERAKRFNVTMYERVAKLIGREAQQLQSLATKMRLSQHASYDKKKSKGPSSSAPPPWEDEDDED